MYDRQLYPNYLSGSGYVFTMDTAKKLYNASMEVPLLYLEDVYTTGKGIILYAENRNFVLEIIFSLWLILTGICAEKARIKPTNCHLFSYLSFRDLCEVRGIITMHEINTSEMKKAYDFVLNTNITCPPPRKYNKIRPFKKAKNCN